MVTLITAIIVVTPLALAMTFWILLVLNVYEVIAISYAWVFLPLVICLLWTLVTAIWLHLVNKKEKKRN